jgi:hypothetical protein
MSAEWHWVNLQGANHEELIADLCEGDGRVEGAGLGRLLVVVQTNATSSFHISFSSTAAVPFRNTPEPVLRFVVGKRQNSMTSCGLGNPYIKKTPIDFTKSPDALLSDDPEKSRTYWFLYDRDVAVAAMGVQAAPQADLCRLVCRFKDVTGFREEACAQLRYISVSSGKRPVSLRVVGVGAPPDVSIPRFRFDPLAWKGLEWRGSSFVFALDEVHRQLLVKAQKLLAASPIAPFYGITEPHCLCLNAYRLLDPLRRPELFPGQDCADLEWPACHAEVHERLAPILSSAPWTYWPLRFEKADCTSVTLAPTGKVCSQVISEWAKAVQGASQLRNGALGREMLTLTFAFEVFPVEGENLAQARRDLVREITGMLEKEWGIMEFRSPFLACWETYTSYVPFRGWGSVGEGGLTTAY